MSNPRNSSTQNKPWSALMASVCSHSLDLESGLQKQNGWGALAVFEDLVKTIHHSLHPPVEAPQKALEPQLEQRHPTNIAHPTPEPARTARIVGHSAPPTQYATRKNEYAPALNQNDLVEALLRYQNQRSSRSKITQSGHAQTRAAGSKNSQSAASPATSAQLNAPEFSPMQVPFVAAEPKDSRLTSKRNAGVRIPILRPKPENRNGGN